MPQGRAAVLGHPIAHSLSPVLHRAAYAELGLDWSYEALDVEPTGLAAVVAAVGTHWSGLSLTMPLKEAVLDLLDAVEPRAAEVRAVNTVVPEGEGCAGYNTDITGLVGIFTDLALPRSARAAVIGAGATARSTVAALAEAGIADVRVLARRPDAVSELVGLASVCGVPGSGGQWPPEASDLARDLVISTVPASATGSWTLPNGLGVLIDVLYDPWPTPLAARWLEGGGAVIGGLELLARQAVEQVVLMTGHRPSLSTLRAAGEAALASRSIAQAEQ
jgi:shikimate dehydrogenase